MSDCHCATLTTQFDIDFRCPACGGSGYVLIEDEAEPCDAGDCDYWAKRQPSVLAHEMARAHAVEYGFLRTPSWWQSTLDQEDRAKQRGPRG